MNELELLNFYNSWWLTGKTPEELLKKYHRDLFTSLEHELPYKDYQRIISLVGPRQTGKTTLLYQLIDLLLSKKIDPKKILFLSMSDPLIAGQANSFEKYLNSYEKVVLKESFGNLKEPIYIFLDEIQYLGKWELWLKRYYDLGYRIKFIISGSASSRIIQKGRESLAGRIVEKKLYPFSFREFISYEISKTDNMLKHEAYNLWSTSFRHKIQKIFTDLNTYGYSSFGRRLLEQKSEIALRQELGNRYLYEYIEKGGFPGVYKDQDIATVYRYLNQDVLDRVTAQDIPQIAEVRDIQLLQSLIVTVARNTSGIFSYRNLAMESGVRSETIRSYLSYLSAAFLTGELWQYRKAEMARFKANKKIYICDTGLRNAILKYSLEKIHSDEEKGIEAETLVYNHLLSTDKKISFWRIGDNEVDFIIDKYGFIIPIEVKFRKEIKKDMVQGLIKFNDTYKSKGGIVVTETLLNYEDGLIYIPLWLFLLSY